MATYLRLPMLTSMPTSSSSSSQSSRRRNLRTFCSVKLNAATNKSKIPIPPLNPKDPFLSKLASVAATSPETLLSRPANSDTPPYLDIFDSPKLMATPAQVTNPILCFYIFVILGLYLISLRLSFL